MAKRGKASGAGEASVPPALSASERETVDASVASLSGLNLDQLRLQWRNQLGGIAPAHLPGWLLMRVLAYRIQAAALGDLDRTILRRLRDDARELGDARPFAPRGPPTPEGVGLKSGALLVREWSGRLERVMVLDDGYAWNGCVYRSLSQVAKAITGTNWNGHRFFGLKAVRNGAPNRKRSATPGPNPLLDIGMTPTLAGFAPAMPDGSPPLATKAVRFDISERIGSATELRGRAHGPSSRPAQGHAFRAQRVPATSSIGPGGPTMKRDERKIALRCAVYTRVSTPKRPTGSLAHGTTEASTVSRSDADSAGGTDASPAPLAFPRFAITPPDGIAGSRHVQADPAAFRWSAPPQRAAPRYPRPSPSAQSDRLILAPCRRDQSRRRSRACAGR